MDRAEDFFNGVSLTSGWLPQLLHTTNDTSCPDWINAEAYFERSSSDLCLLQILTACITRYPLR